MKQALKILVYPLVPVRLRYPKEFWATYAFAQKANAWSSQRLREYQWRRLIETINWAYEHSTYYNRRFCQLHIKPGDIRNYEDYRSNVPILTKEELRNHLESMVALPKKGLEYSTTGGSTGVPVGIYLQKRIADSARDAFDWARFFNKGGYNFKDCVAVLRGRLVGESTHLWDPKRSHLVLSTFDMTESNLHLYVKLLEDYRVQHILAYPSAADALARFVSGNYPKFNENRVIRSMFTSSEVLFPFQKRLIEEALRVKVFDLYGNTEQTSRMATCHYGNYHDFMEYAYSEFLDDEGNAVTSGVARLVSTSFSNPALPLLRYDTGDLVDIDLESTCPCGLAHTTVKSINGRAQEYLIGKSGERISVAALNSHTEAFDNVERFRYIQMKPGEAVIEVIKSKKFTQDDEGKVLEEARVRTKRHVDLSIKYVESIPLTAAGKFSFVVNRIPSEARHVRVSLDPPSAN